MRNRSTKKALILLPSLVIHPFHVVSGSSEAHPYTAFIPFAMDTAILRNDDHDRRVRFSQEEKPFFPSPSCATQLLKPILQDEKLPLHPSSIASSPASLHLSQSPSFQDWCQHISQLDYGTLSSLHQRAPLIQTPYSDISNQEEFAANYRRIIFLIYNAGIPLTLFLISAVAKLLFRSSIVGWGCFLLAVTVVLLGWAFFALAGMFEVGDFLNMHKIYFIWPISLLLIGAIVMKPGSGGERDVGITFVILGTVIIVANLSAWLTSRIWLEKRTELWPPLDDVEFVV